MFREYVLVCERKADITSLNRTSSSSSVSRPLQQHSSNTCALLPPTGEMRSGHQSALQGPCFYYAFIFRNKNAYKFSVQIKKNKIK